MESADASQLGHGDEEDHSRDLASQEETWRAIRGVLELRHKYLESKGIADRCHVQTDEERGECMRTMDPRRPTPIVHVTGGGLPPERRERRVDALGLRRNASRVWSTCLTRLDSRGGAGPCPAQRPEVTVGGAVVLGACGCPSESASP